GNDRRNTSAHSKSHHAIQPYLQERRRIPQRSLQTLRPPSPAPRRPSVAYSTQLLLFVPRFRPPLRLPLLSRLLGDHRPHARIQLLPTHRRRMDDPSPSPFLLTKRRRILQLHFPSRDP